MRDTQRIKVINNYVADKYGVTVDEILGTNTSDLNLKARYMSMFLSWRYTRVLSDDLARMYNKKPNSLDKALDVISKGNLEVKDFIKWAKIDLGYE